MLQLQRWLLVLTGLPPALPSAGQRAGAGTHPLCPGLLPVCPHPSAWGRPAPHGPAHFSCPFTWRLHSCPQSGVFQVVSPSDYSIHNSQLHRGHMSAKLLKKKKREGKGNVMVTTTPPIPATSKPLGKEPIGIKGVR